MPGVGLVRRKKVVVLQCRHILRMNQHNRGGHQHQHHRYRRSARRHFDGGNMRLSATKNPSRDTGHAVPSHFREPRESALQKGRLEIIERSKREVRMSESRAGRQSWHIIKNPASTVTRGRDTFIRAERVSSLWYAHLSRAFKPIRRRIDPSRASALYVRRSDELS